SSSSGASAQLLYEPSPMDVIIVKSMLQQGLRLPPEVVLSIVEAAEYWPHTTALLDASVTVRSGRATENHFLLRSQPLGFTRKTHYDDRHYALTRAPPQPLSPDGEYPVSQFQSWIQSPTSTLEHPCRKIVFTITSHDQGWSGNALRDRGSYRGSNTFFCAGLERFDKNAARPQGCLEREPQAEEDAEPLHDDPLPDPYLPVYALRPIHPAVYADRPEFDHPLHPDRQLTIQHNKTAIRDPTTHVVVWSWNDDKDPLTAEELKEMGRGEATGDGAFVRSLKLGDVVTVWAMSRFGSWVNFVQSVKVDIYWSL
ncbi:hypothetical protein M406DRAFT_221822, partial [Cryphonectria parasitica EP155]